MIVMPSNNCKAEVHFWQGLHGGLGHLYAPGGQRGPYNHLPYALDNGAYGAFLAELPFNAQAFICLMEWAKEQTKTKKHNPLWVVVPDVVAQPIDTLVSWKEWAPRIKAEYKWPLALAVQDGMLPAHIEELEVKPDVLFVGGTFKWKWETLPVWCETDYRVHVGRCNRPDALYRCANLGVESVDGTGWFRGDPAQTDGLRRFLKHQADGTAARYYADTFEPLFPDE